MVQVLRQVLDQLQKDISFREAILKGFSDRKPKGLEKIQEEHEKRMAEVEGYRKQAEQHRQEDKEHRERLIDTLDQLTSVLTTISIKLDNLDRK